MGLPGHLLVLVKQFAEGELVAQMKRSVNESPLLRPMVQSKVVPYLGTHVTSDGLDPVFVYQDFLNGIAETAQIIRSTSNDVKRAEAFRRGYASKSMLILLLLLTFIAFCCGVTYPLTGRKVRQVIALWLPLGVYLLIGILALGKIL